VPEVRLLELRNTYKWGGGPDKTILLSAQQHDRSKVMPVVAYIRDVKDQEFQITAKAKAMGLHYYEIPERWKFDPNVVRAIRNIAIREDINLIHSHDYKTDFFALLVGLWLGRRRIALVSTAHAWVMLGFRGECYRRLDLRLMRHFDHLVAVSHATKREMLDASIPEEKITVIHNGIDTNTWSRVRTTTTLREELGLVGAFPVIGYVGRIMPEKDLKTWLRAGAIIAKSYPNARFLLVGEGKDVTTLGELESLAKSLGIAEQVIFVGYRSDLPQVYASFDLFVLSSLREGLPNSILEAMALEVPVVTTDVAGAKELVLDGATGFVVPQGNAERLADMMLKILANDRRRTGMGRAGRQRVEAEFSFAGRLTRIEDLYSQVVKRKFGVPKTPATVLGRV
jgi:glycosyltransferase involved in cell wall biosynthesis